MERVQQGKSYKQFDREAKRNERKRKTKQGRRSNAEYSPPNETKVSQEKGTRLGGSTSHLLPEPRANQVQGIERYDTPPPPSGDF